LKNTDLTKVSTKENLSNLINENSATNLNSLLLMPSLKTTLLYLIVAVVFSSLGVLFSFTRGVWLASAFGLVAMLYLLNKRWMLISIGIGAVVIAGLFVVSPQFKERLSTAVDMNHRHHDERKLVWKTNLEMFKDYPLLGIGWRDNTRRLDEYYDRLQISQDTIKSHAHNQYIQFLSTTGILGLGFYLAIWWWLFKLAYQNWQRLKMSSQSNHSGVTQADQMQLLWMKGLSLGALGAFMAFQIASLSETNFDDAKANYMLSFVIASVFWVQQHLDQYVSLDSIDS
jgi:O-antigen ligase